MGVKNVERNDSVPKNDLENIDAAQLSDSENFFGFSQKKAKNHPDNGKYGHWEVRGIRHKAIITTDNAISAIQLAAEVVYEWELCDVMFIGKTLPDVYEVI